jgi:hypothetical protein
MYAGWKKIFSWFAMGRLPFSSMGWLWLRLSDLKQQIPCQLLGQDEMLILISRNGVFLALNMGKIRTGRGRVLILVVQLQGLVYLHTEGALCSHLLTYDTPLMFSLSWMFP